MNIMNEHTQPTPSLDDALAQLQALTANIVFTHHNSRNGRVIITQQASGELNMAYEQAPLTAGANRYFRRPTPTRVMDSIVEQQMRTGTHHIEQDRQTQRFIRPAVERALKHTSPTATPSEFYGQVVNELGEQVHVADIRTALRSILREQ